MHQQHLAAADPDRGLTPPEPCNHGIQQATGKYVMFLDSDDVLERNA
ncbi:glycosyltransferase family A protein, partial [Streptomyces sp. NPDC002587]